MFKLQIGVIFDVMFLHPYDFAYNPNISFFFKLFARRSVISSQAELELQHTKTYLFVVRIISKIAVTIQRVFPVPGGPKRRKGRVSTCSFKMHLTANFCSVLRMSQNLLK